MPQIRITSIARALAPLAVMLLAFSCTSSQKATPTAGPVPTPFVVTGSDDMSLEGLVPAPAPDSSDSLAGKTADWYKDANFYHIWVSSFCDSDGNGIGDLRGISSKLDYLKGLGVSGIWLSPFFKNASNMPNLHGYDATDMDTVDPRLGTNEDLKALLQAAHSRGIRVIFDFVPNHVSNRHPWFQDSKAGLNDKRDWFLWTENPPASGWANWGGSSSWHRAGNAPDGNPQYYYAIFWDGMPDLNYRNPEVRKAMAGVVRKWLDFGFDGLRVDAVRYLVESPNGAVNGVGSVYQASYDFFQNLRSVVLDPYAALGYPKFMMCENWGPDNGSFEGFMVKDGKRGFNMSLDFGFGTADYAAVNGGLKAFSSGLEKYWTGTVMPLEQKDAWTATFLNNHDNYQSRPASAFAGDKKEIALAAALQYAGPGMPIWYYGNEVGMEGENQGADINFRRPMDWSALPAAQADSGSTYNAAKSLMALRSSRASLRRGDYQSVETDAANTTAFLRSLGAERTLVVLNFGSAGADLTAALPASAKAAKLLWGQASASTSGTNVAVKGLAGQSCAVFSVE